MVPHASSVRARGRGRCQYDITEEGYLWSLTTSVSTSWSVLHIRRDDFFDAEMQTLEYGLTMLVESACIK